MSKSLYRAIRPDDHSGEEEGKVIILHGFSPAQIQAVVAAYRERSDLPQDVAFAIVTPRSARRRLGEVVRELQEDARAHRARKRQNAPEQPSS
ncbi:MAG: hypothetical protein KatS3mg115_2499 [Candidatus Poribacteria bacterium]|nr:MAG: hypothetical protein KatS3mg115_2499 [Candidatus Poribacteria bacterium]